LISCDNYGHKSANCCSQVHTTQPAAHQHSRQTRSCGFCTTSTYHSTIFPSSNSLPKHKQSNRRSHFTGAVHSHHPLLGRSYLQQRVTMHCQKSFLKTTPSPWDFVTLSEEDRATAIGNMHRKIGKNHAYGSRDILADRQTDRRAHHNTSPPLPRTK